MFDSNYLFRIFFSRNDGIVEYQICLKHDPGRKFIHTLKTSVAIGIMTSFFSTTVGHPKDNVFTRILLEVSCTY